MASPRVVQRRACSAEWRVLIPQQGLNCSGLLRSRGAHSHLHSGLQAGYGPRPPSRLTSRKRAAAPPHLPWLVWPGISSAQCFLRIWHCRKPRSILKGSMDKKLFPYMFVLEFLEESLEEFLGAHYLVQRSCSINVYGVFPGGPVIRTCCFHCHGPGSIPGEGLKSHKPCSK